MKRPKSKQSYVHGIVKSQYFFLNLWLIQKCGQICFYHIFGVTSHFLKQKKWSHLNGFPPECALLEWIFKWSFVMLEKSHCGHLWGFNPACVIMCLLGVLLPRMDEHTYIQLPARLNDLLRCEHFLRSENGRPCDFSDLQLDQLFPCIGRICEGLLCCSGSPTPYCSWA